MRTAKHARELYEKLQKLIQGIFEKKRLKGPLRSKASRLAMYTVATCEDVVSEYILQEYLESRENGSSVKLSAHEFIKLSNNDSLKSLAMGVRKLRLLDRAIR